MSTPTTDKPVEEQHNPEALTDAPANPPANANFQNVDLEANAAPAAAPAATKNDKPKSGVVELADSLEFSTINWLLAFAAIIVMISSATICGGGVLIFGVPTGEPCTGIAAYQVALGTVSTFLALITALAAQTGSLASDQVKTGIAGFQFLWWLAGMIVLTFFGSFQTVFYGNGYFGTWAALLFSILALVSVSDLFERAVDKAAKTTRSPLLLLILTSAVVMGAAIGPCSPSSACVTYNAFALALGTVSLGVSIIVFLLATKLPNSFLRVIAAFFVLWWGVGACVVTFGGPFVSPGNGYFASLGAVLASVQLLRGAAASA